MCLQGIQQVAKYITLRDTYVKDEGFGSSTAHSDDRSSGSQEVQTHREVFSPINVLFHMSHTMFLVSTDAKG